MKTEDELIEIYQNKRRQKEREEWLKREKENQDAPISSILSTYDEEAVKQYLWEEGYHEGMMEAQMERINALMEKTGMPIIETMNLLSLPEEEQGEILAEIRERERQEKIDKAREIKEGIRKFMKEWSPEKIRYFFNQSEPDNGPYGEEYLSLAFFQQMSLLSRAKDISHEEKLLLVVPEGYGSTENYKNLLNQISPVPVEFITPMDAEIDYYT